MTNEHADIESWMSDTWESLLSFQPNGPESNFFEIGGDSLMMLELLTAIDQKFSIEFPVTVAFKEPTLGGMISEVKRQTSSDAA